MWQHWFPARTLHPLYCSIAPPTFVCASAEISADLEILLASASTLIRPLKRILSSSPPVNRNCRDAWLGLDRMNSPSSGHLPLHLIWPHSYSLASSEPWPLQMRASILARIPIKKEVFLEADWWRDLLIELYTYVTCIFYRDLILSMKSFWGTLSLWWSDTFDWDFWVTQSRHRTRSRIS